MSEEKRVQLVIPSLNRTLPPPPLAAAVLPAPHQVDHHVLVEGVPPLGRHLAHVDDSLGVVSVDVEDGGVDHSGHVGGVGGGAGHTGVGGEADLQRAKGQRSANSHSLFISRSKLESLVPAAVFIWVPVAVHGLKHSSSFKI